METSFRVSAERSMHLTTRASSSFPVDILVWLHTNGNGALGTSALVHPVSVAIDASAPFYYSTLVFFRCDLPVNDTSVSADVLVPGPSFVFYGSKH